MRYLTDVGFVLKRVNFSESDRYITIFSKYHGKIEVVARGVRKITSRRASHVEMLNLIEFQSVKGHKNYILTEAVLINPYSSLKQDLKCIEKVFLLCELINLLCPPHEVHSEVFMLLENLLRKIEIQQLENVNFVAFQQKLLMLLGFWDGKKEFSDEGQVRYFIEQIIEKKLKTKTFFKI